MTTDCVTWTEAFGLTNHSEARTGLNDTLVVPCETCVVLSDFTGKENVTTLDLRGRGLDVEGILIVPNNTRVEIITPYVFVQGEFNVESTKLIDGVVDVRVVMVGTEDVFFFPHERNKVEVKEELGEQGELGYNAGKKPFLVAGGRINIRGMPAWNATTKQYNTTTWGRLESVERLPAPVLEPGSYPAPSAMSADLGCDPDVLLNVEDNGPDNNRTVRLPLQFRDCLLKDTRYLYEYTFRLRPANGMVSQCASTRTDCPRLALARVSRFQEQPSFYSSPLATVHPGEATSLDVKDDEWITIVGELAFDTSHLNTKFNSLALFSPDNTDVELSSVAIRLPPAEAFPVTNVCSEMAINGDAERDDQPFPFVTSVGGVNKLLVREYSDVDAGDGHSLLNDDGTPNTRYFHMPGRSAWWVSPTFDLPLGCMEDRAVYRFSAKVRVRSDVPTRVAAVLKTYHPRNATHPDEWLYGGPFHFDVLEICPRSSNDIGWVDCDAAVMLDHRHANATRVQFLMVVKDDSVADLDLDDVSFVHRSGAGTEKIRLNSTIHNAWRPGAEVVMASQTFEWDDDQVLKVASVDKDGNVTFEEDMVPKSPASLEEQPDYAGEFALLSRNIEFTALEDDEDEPNHGGHLMIFKTPHCTGRDGKPNFKCEGYDQHIDGVLFTNFGQEGESDRFPINVYDSGDLRSSSFSYNAFRNTFQRCININKSHYVRIEQNVAYNTTGHCYVVERPWASRNNFDRNIGLRTIKNKKRAIRGWDELLFPATFVFTDPVTWVTNNVAAGSQGVGFWYYNGWWSQSTILKFDRNVAHSIAHNAIQTFPNGWDSKGLSRFTNIKVYRNRGIGWYCHLGQNFVVQNGLFADNKIALDVNYCDGVTIKDTKIIGYTLAYEEVTELDKLKRHCWTDEYSQYGVRLHPNNKNTRFRGSHLDGVDFSRFQRHLGCKDNKFILMNDDRVIDDPRQEHHIYNMTVDSKYVFDDLTFDEVIQFPLHENVMNFCPLNATTVNDLYIADDGALNPEQNGYGFIVNDHPNMTMWSTKCVDLVDTCSKYCTGPGSCMTKVTIGIDRQNTENVDLHVFNADGVKVRGVDGITVHDPADFESRRFYWFYLPAGSYTGKFLRDGAEFAWPTYAEIMIDHPHPPNCPGYEYEYQQLAPPTEPGFCDDLAINGDLEEGEDGTNRWYFNERRRYVTEPRFEVVSPGFGGSAKAIATGDRRRVETGLVHFVDTRCFATVGDEYRVEARVKVEGGCNPHTVKSGNNRCVRASLRSRLNGWDLDYKLAVADTLETPFESEGWNRLHGEFVVTQDMIDADNMAFFFEGPNKEKKFTIDSLTVTKIHTPCTPLMLNDGFEEGDNRHWSSVGDKTKLTLVNNTEEFGGSGHSIRVLDRSHVYHGINYLLDRKEDCLQVGTTYEVSVDYRLEETETGETVESDCDPMVAYSGVGSTCPIIGVKVKSGEGDETYHHVGLPYGPYRLGDWNKIYGFFTLTQEMMDASELELYVSRTKASKNLVIDDFVFKEADADTFGIRTCASTSNLIVNGDAETGDTRNWSIKGSGDFGTITMVPGAGGSSHAFHHSGRTRNYHGLWQTVDQDCMAVGSTWTVSADFLLFDENGDPAECVPDKMYNVVNCPSFFFQSYTLSEGLYQTTPLLNEAISVWNKGEWNRYEATFTMTAQHKEKDETWFFIHKVLAGYSYTVDNIKMVPAGAGSSTR